MKFNDEMIDLRFIDMQNQVDTLRNQLTAQMKITLDLIRILKKENDR